MAVKYERIVEEDLNLGVGTVDVSMPGGGTAVGHRIGPQTFSALTFIATSTGGQSVHGGSAAAVVQMTEEEVDVADWFSLVSYAFLPTVAGRYHVDAYLALETFTGVATLAIYKNSDVVVAIDMVRESAAGQTAISALIDLDGETDVVTVRISHNDGTNDRLVTAARFSGYLVGRTPAE